MLVLAGDVGGTNVRLAVFEVSNDRATERFSKTFSVFSHSSFLKIIEEFLFEFGDKVNVAAFAVAGAVISGKSEILNVGWTLSEENLSQSLGGIPVRLINDLVGWGYSIPLLKSSDLEVINRGITDDFGAISIIAPGTGLGQGYVVSAKDNVLIPRLSEGGHSDFAPVDDQQVELLKFLMKTYSHVSYERVCSGIGIPNLYNFLKDTGSAKEPDWLNDLIAESEDPVPIIVENVENSNLCDQTMILFTKILGAEAGNLALKTLSTKGVYLGGGIPPRIQPYIQKYFMPAFVRKGRYKELMESIPVKLIIHKNPALLGVVEYAKKMN